MLVVRNTHSESTAFTLTPTTTPKKRKTPATAESETNSAKKARLASKEALGKLEKVMQTPPRKLQRGLKFDDIGSPTLNDLSNLLSNESSVFSGAGAGAGAGSSLDTTDSDDEGFVIHSRFGRRSGGFGSPGFEMPSPIPKTNSGRRKSMDTSDDSDFSTGLGLSQAGAGSGVASSPLRTKPRRDSWSDDSLSTTDDPRTPVRTPVRTPMRDNTERKYVPPAAPCRWNPSTKSASTINVITIHGDKDIKNSVTAFTLNGVRFPVKELGHGDFHAVYGSDSDQDIILEVDPEKGVMERTTFKPRDYVVKLVRINNGRGSACTTSNSVALDTIKAVKDLRAIEGDLKATGWNLPRTLILPDPNAHDNAFYLVEKLDRAVDISQWGKPGHTYTADDRTLLETIKRELTIWGNSGKKCDIDNRMVLEKCRIDDLMPRNVMWKNNNLYPSDESVDTEQEIWQIALGWSNGSEEIWNYLLSDTHEDVKADANEWLASKKEKNGGEFPTA